ncbi:MAG: hypothetical protein QM687_03660 [Ferruginibacter sp.]
MKTLLLLSLLLCAFCYLPAQDTLIIKTKEKRAKADLTPAEQKDCCCEEQQPVCKELTDAVQPTDIVIDLRSKKIGNKKDWYAVKRGDYIRLKLLNYNPLLYKIIVNGTDSAVATPVDGKLLPWFLDPANLTGIIAGLTDKTGTVPVSIKANIYDFNGAVENADSLFINYYEMASCDLTLPAKKGNKPLPAADTPKLVSCLKDFYARQGFLMEESNKQIEMAQKETSRFLLETMRRFSIQRRLYPDCDAFKKLADTNGLKKLQADFELYQDGIADMRKAIWRELEIYELTIAALKGLIAKNAELQQHDMYVRKFYSTADSVLKKYGEQVSYTKLGELMTRLETMALYSSCYISLPMLVKDDVKNLNINIKSRYDSLGLPDYNTVLAIPPSQHKTWGISGGIFVSGLHNEMYTVKQTDTLYSLVKEKPGTVQLGINALAYMGWRLGENDRHDYLGVSFGAGMSIEAKPKPRVLAGMSFITGDKNRVLFSIGAAGGNVRELSNAYVANASYRAAPADYLVDRMRVSWFVSVNYSFGNK